MTAGRSGERVRPDHLRQLLDGHLGADAAQVAGQDLLHAGLELLPVDEAFVMNARFDGPNLLTVGWQIEPGKIELMVGGASDAIKVRGVLSIEGSATGSRSPASIPVPSEDRPAAVPM